MLQEKSLGEKEDENLLDSKLFNETPVVPKGCQGVCQIIRMDLPPNNSWSNQSGFHPWYPSHGTPSVGLNSIWLWSANGIGEGVNLAYSFLG